MEDLNRIKVVLVEKKRTSKWLSEQLGINPSTVSKWCTNTSQPDLETFMKIAKILNVDMNNLVRFEALSFISPSKVYKSKSDSL